MAEFLMPSLGADMDSATLTEWMIKPGDTVERGAIVASVETSKGIIDIEIFAAGRSVRRSSTSASMPSPASSSAASSVVGRVPP